MLTLVWPLALSSLGHSLSYLSFFSFSAILVQLLRRLALWKTPVMRNECTGGVRAGRLVSRQTGGSPSKQLIQSEWNDQAYYSPMTATETVFVRAFDLLIAVGM